MISRNHGGNNNSMLCLSEEECQHSTFWGCSPSMPSLEMAGGLPLTQLLCVTAAVEMRLLETGIIRVGFFFSFGIALLYSLFRNLT